MWHDVWPLFFSRWLWSLWRVPCKDIVGIHDPLNPSFLQHPCFSHSTHWPATTGSISAVCLSGVSWTSVSFPLPNLYIKDSCLALAMTKFSNQDYAMWVCAECEDPCQEGGHAISLRSCICYSGCHLLCFRECAPKRSFTCNPFLMFSYPR